MLSGKLKFSPRVKLCFYAILMAFIVIILINSVRSALVIAFCGVIITVILIGGRLRARMRTSLIACVVLALGALAISQSVSQGGVTNRFGSTLSNPTGALQDDRRTFFDDGLNIISLSPLGVGLGRTGAAAGRLGSGAGNNTLGFMPFSEAYLGTMIFETGIIGAILITSVLVMLMVRGYRAMVHLQEPDDRFLSASILSVFVVIFANFFVSPILLGPPGTVLFWLLGGALMRVYPAGRGTQ